MKNFQLKKRKTILTIKVKKYKVRPSNRFGPTRKPVRTPVHYFKPYFKFIYFSSRKRENLYNFFLEYSGIFDKKNTIFL
jgi:hypothetical protein